MWCAQSYTCIICLTTERLFSLTDLLARCLVVVVVCFHSVPFSFFGDVTRWSPWRCVTAGDDQTYPIRDYEIYSRDSDLMRRCRRFGPRPFIPIPFFVATRCDSFIPHNRRCYCFIARWIFSFYYYFIIMAPKTKTAVKTGLTAGEKKKQKQENKAKANPEKAAAKKEKSDAKRERRWVILYYTIFHCIVRKMHYISVFEAGVLYTMDSRSQLMRKDFSSLLILHWPFFISLCFCLFFVWTGRNLAQWRNWAKSIHTSRRCWNQHVIFIRVAEYTAGAEGEDWTPGERGIVAKHEERFRHWYSCVSKSFAECHRYKKAALRPV